jgi:hypothetical protein
MSFHPITIGADIFNQTGPGKYSLSSTSFGDPANEIRITGGSFSTKSNTNTCVVTRVIEKDVTVGSEVNRRRLIVTVQMTVPVGFTATDVDDALNQVDQFIDLPNLNRILLGES